MFAVPARTDRRGSGRLAALIAAWVLSFHAVAWLAAQGMAAPPPPPPPPPPGAGMVGEARMVAFDGTGRVGAAPTPMATGTGAIVGQVIDAAGRRPVAGAVVTLRLSGSTPLRVLADAQGRFVFTELPQGSFTLDASKPGYSDGSYGRSRPEGPAQSVALDAGAVVRDATIAVWKFGAISGVIRDEAGEPMIGVTVRALRRSLSGGRPQLTNGPTDVTDDRGTYRLRGLAPGQYVVSVPIAGLGTIGPAMMTIRSVSTGARVSSLMQEIAGTPSSDGGMSMRLDVSAHNSVGTLPNGRDLIYENWFYPSTTSVADATPIRILSGDDRVAVDVQVKPVAASRVSGTVLGPAGPVPNTLLELRPADGAVVAPVLTAVTASDVLGVFTFAAVPPGQYVIRVRQGAPFVAPIGALRMEIAVAGPPPGSVASGPVTSGPITAERSAVGAGPGAPPSGGMVMFTAPDGLSDDALWADVAVTVDRPSVEDVAVMLTPGVVVSGTVSWSGAATRPTARDLSSVVARLEPAEAMTTKYASAVRATINETGAFRARALFPGRYVLRVSGLPTGWHLTAATAGGLDVIDRPLEVSASDVSDLRIEFRDRPGGADVTGTIARGRAQSAEDEATTVVIFPAESDAWRDYGTAPRRLRSAVTDRSGAFTFANMPAGRYVVAAVGEQDADLWQDPVFLERLSSTGATVDVREGTRATATVQVPR